jgi:acyl-CoA thioesterase FadM
MQSSPYRFPCFIPFHLADPAGILFFGHLFSLFHQAFEQFVIHQLECPWNLWFQNPEWIVPIKQTEAQYLSPLQAGQECLIELSVIAFSLSSFTLTASFYQQQQLCCVAKTIHVFCNRLNKQKMPIPPTLLSQLTLAIFENPGNTIS